jgi:hypothetical protein
MPYDEVPTPDQLEDLVYNITVSDGMVPGSKRTRHQLKHLNCWPEWHASEKEQLDEMALALAKMFGKPASFPVSTIVLRSAWQNSVKHDGRKKARTCCDGSDFTRRASADPSLVCTLGQLRLLSLCDRFT